MNHEEELREQNPFSPPVRRRRKRRRKKWPVVLAVLAAIGVCAVLCLILIPKNADSKQPAISGQTEGSEQNRPLTEEGAFYAAGIEPEIPVYDAEGNVTDTLVRGTQVSVDPDEGMERGGKTFYPLQDNGAAYLCEDNLAGDLSEVVPRTEVYVRTSQSLYTAPDSLTLRGVVEKGTTVTVIGYDGLQEDGTVRMYQVQTDTTTGYLRPEYLTLDEEEARLPYDQTGTGAFHLGRGDLYGGGKAGTLDYYPREKLDSETNLMPENCYSLYLNSETDTMELIDDYIAFAQSTTINTFVVDIMDGKSIGYPSPVMETYSPTSYYSANNTLEEYQAVIQKLKDAGFYVVGRITTFNDLYFAKDHPECAISDASGEPIEFSGTYWPSVYSRYAWEYKVALAKEAVELMGFNEIQFDYVRFPDGTYSYEQENNIDYHNEYSETKAQAVQRFLMYACDELHEIDTYVSADVFGETSNPYVAAYGQYFPAISNVVDVISGMPYPDHYAQSGDYRPWEHPYDTIDTWAEGVVQRQSEIPTPAIVRTWIQAYDAILYPYNEYGAEEVWQEISALRDNGLTAGFITWNPGASISKYKSLKEAFDALK